MKYLKQFGILAGITCMGEILHYFIPLPIPGSVYGLLLLLMLLMTGALKVEQVKEAAEFLIEIMPVLFIPAAAGLVVNWPALSKMLLPVCVIIVVSTFLVMIVTGKTAETMLRYSGKRNTGGRNAGAGSSGNGNDGSGNAENSMTRSSDPGNRSTADSNTGARNVGYSGSGAEKRGGGAGHAE